MCCKHSLLKIFRVFNFRMPAACMKIFWLLHAYSHRKTALFKLFSCYLLFSEQVNEDEVNNRDTCVFPFHSMFVHRLSIDMHIVGLFLEVDRYRMMQLKLIVIHESLVSKGCVNIYFC